MPSIDSRVHDQCICTVDVIEDEVDAGCAFAVTARAACPERCDLGAAAIAFSGPGGGEPVIAGLRRSDDGEGYVTGEVTLTAPAAAGTHRFSATIMPPPEGPVHAAAPAEFAITSRSHAARMNLWDVPSAIVAGEEFRFKVGLKCSAGCRLAGRRLLLLDGDGRTVATAKLGDEVWRGTTALYFAEVTARAPGQVGRHAWTLRAPADDSGLPHGEGTAPLSLNVVDEPACEIVIEAVDRDDQTPIRGASVVMHPYRTVSDDQGIARLKAARGNYSIVVSARKHIPVRTDVALTGDLVTRAELEREPPPFNPDDLY
jgi:hypothetical protein